MKLLFIILLEFFSLGADAQTISSIVIDWVDDQVETPWDITPYQYDKGNFKTFRKVVNIVDAANITAVYSILENLNERENPYSLDMRGKITIYYKDGFVDVAYFNRFRIKYKGSTYCLPSNFLGWLEGKNELEHKGTSDSIILKKDSTISDSSEVSCIRFDWIPRNTTDVHYSSPYTFDFVSNKKLRRTYDFRSEENLEYLQLVIKSLDEVSQKCVFDIRGKMTIYDKDDFVDVAYFGDKYIKYRDKMYLLSDDFVRILSILDLNYEK